MGGLIIWKGKDPIFVHFDAAAGAYANFDDVIRIAENAKNDLD